MRSLLLIALVLGCGAPAWDSPEEVGSVMADWNVLEMPQWEIRTLDRGALLQLCHGTKRPESDDLDACTLMKERVTFASDDLGPERRRMMLLHELGHLLRGGPNVHLDCGDDVMGDDVMCTAGAWEGTIPTARDRAFVGAP